MKWRLNTINDENNRERFHYWRFDDDERNGDEREILNLSGEKWQTMMTGH